MLADRGLAGAIQALALDMSLPVSVTIVLPGVRRRRSSRRSTSRRASCWPTSASMRLRRGHRSTCRTTVRDCGSSSRTTAWAVHRRTPGSGLAGVVRRLAAFDGTMDVVSPVGGPTVVVLEVPCALSSPKISPSSGMA
ncbi:hypothetical protein [Aeromicrobium sp. UC242_57]|uniref:hypothetical protein n=1 Tax=Aeromicrobium sp. UC242_57 TaxID=3374624 RepID=UPI0037BD8E4B